MTPEHRRQLDRIKVKVHSNKLLLSDEYNQSVHAKLYCIELFGALEHLIRDCCVYYCKNCANDYVQNFVSSTSKRFPNPNAHNILNTISSFDKNWGEKLENFWDGEVKDAVSSIVSNRHHIAHGKNCNISIIKVRNWHGSVNSLSNFLWNEVFQLR